MPKNTLDVEKLRQRSSTDVLKDFEMHKGELDKICAAANNPPVKEWAEPNSISSLTGEQLADCMYNAARMYGHYRSLETAAEQLQRGIRGSMEVLGASLRRSTYRTLPKDEQKDAVMLDKQYGAAKRIEEELSYILGNVQGESKRWGKLTDAFSRDFERRRDELPRQPRKHYPDPTGSGIGRKK